MSERPPQPVYRKDYRPADFSVDRVELVFDLGEEETLVKAKLTLRRNPRGQAALRLDGEGLELRAIAIDGRPLSAAEYRVETEYLLVPAPPERFVLETEVAINPRTNTELSGLYLSQGIFCTQCEAEGFRRITYFFDRPDVMATYSVTISADRTLYPVLLSNGNRLGGGQLEGGRHWVQWEDPFPKPSYLFALVGGDLRCHRGTYTTGSGRQVGLEVWVEPQNIDRCQHALEALIKAMEWDEAAFGLEYDLDIYMIVAVADFNFGAMENKGLNIFNTKYVLAKPATATDGDFEGITEVIAHEYFHNWTGNRVTCRDWFQLTLKEGLTVFRDQLFSAEKVTGAAVKRIDEVMVLRSAQFAEDAGPMAHPIRPESYIVMDNFYTSTVYRKGAEVVRMYYTLLGREGFRRGMDCYFERHDNQAVTCDDFRAAMADANEVDLSQFERWYDQEGTPTLWVEGQYDEAKQTYSLKLRQEQAHNNQAPMHIPVAVGLLDQEGRDLPLVLAGEEVKTTLVLQLRQPEQCFVFEQIEAAPVPSVLRGFSAPVKVRSTLSRQDLAFLAARDTDPFNRWEAGQQLSLALLKGLVEDHAQGRDMVLDPLLAEAVGLLLADDHLDGSFKALALSLPSERVVGQEMEVVQVDCIHAAHCFVTSALARRFRTQFEALYRGSDSGEAYTSVQSAIARRRLKNKVLEYLAGLNEKSIAALALSQFERADNMTDAQGALAALVQMDGPERAEALERFYARWKEEPLVLDKWFGLQAQSRRSDTFEQVVALAQGEDFNPKNPNRVRALLGSFCHNQVHFHRSDGAGYQFLADWVLRLDQINPQTAAALAGVFNPWKRYDELRQGLMGQQLERIGGQKGLSKDTFEIVERARNH